MTIGQIVLPGTTLSVSRLSFGTSRLFSAGRKADRHAIIAEAVRQGFTHFDTAPSYGFGMSELDLGDVLGSDSKITIATKTGLYSPGGEGQPWAAIFARKMMGRAIPTLSTPIADWAVDRARRALAESMKRLRRNHVDILLLHEAELGLLHTDEWLKWIDEELGHRIGAFGVAVSASRLGSVLAANSPIAKLIQTQDSVSGCEADPVLDAGRPLQFTYGYLSSLALTDRTEQAVNTAIKAALHRNKTGSVLVSTINKPRIQTLAVAAG
jgi:D-threo-aldose 1-dehydrogenase